MSKTALSLLLLARLSNGALYKKQELADFLEVTPRKLIELRNDLEVAGYYIETLPGPYGGYRLDKSRSRMISIFNITHNELNTLKFIQKTNPQHEELVTLIEKMEGYLNDHQPIDSYIIPTIDGNRLKDVENIHFELLYKAIKGNYRVECLYQSLDARVKKIYLKPYELYYYKGFWYCITYNPKTKQAYSFKLVRMKEIEITYRTFDRDPLFHLSDFTGDTSIFKGERYRLELLITPPNAIIISEMNLARDQAITPLEDGAILFKGEMEGKVEIISWLLSLGPHVKVLEPIEIREEYAKTVEQMINRLH